MLAQVVTSVITVVKSLGPTGVVNLGSKEGFPETPVLALLPHELPWGPTIPLPPSSPFRDACVYIGPTRIMQANLFIVRSASLIPSAVLIILF